MRKLTGRYKILPSLFGWKILVECHKHVNDGLGGFFEIDVFVWKRARLEDLIELKLM